MTRIGERLREERTRLRFSQSILGSIGGVETNAQGNYESGSRSPKASYLEKIAAAGIDVAYVITGLRASTADTVQQPQAAASESIDSALSAHLATVTHQLHRNLHGIIDALYQMTLLVDARTNKREGDDVRGALDVIKSEAESLMVSTFASTYPNPGHADTPIVSFKLLVK
ncbi:MAG TPA: XRE family transcriptional regulator [Pseudomonas sp.]|uniref:XRE family transcriptional regulator n=1 Tax=Pseudomonas sp. TaxID=306 RepID=UPI002ED90A26